MVVTLPKNSKSPTNINFLLKSSTEKNVLNVIKCTLRNFGVVIFLVIADPGYSGPLDIVDLGYS